jgi:hypothetical protein
MKLTDTIRLFAATLILAYQYPQGSFSSKNPPPANSCHGWSLLSLIRGEPSPFNAQPGRAPKRKYRILDPGCSSASSVLPLRKQYKSVRGPLDTPFWLFSPVEHSSAKYPHDTTSHRRRQVSQSLIVISLLSTRQPRHNGRCHHCQQDLGRQQSLPQLQQ